MKTKKLIVLTIAAMIFGPVGPAVSSHESVSSISADVDYHTGSSSMSLPIQVPSGRAGIQPNLQLQYSSSLPNDVLGVGWLLELGAIQRSTKYGAPKYDNTDTFVLKQSGSTQELIDIGGGKFAPQIEGSFMNIEFVTGSFWRLTDKNGTQYYFGEDQSSQEYDPSDSNHIFKWCLNRVIDVHGNDMTFDYFREDNKLYPQSVHYTGNSQNGLLPFASVEFIYELRNDQFNSYHSGFKRVVSKRLINIDIKAGGQLQRRYELQYTQSNRTNRSLLTSSRQYGSDGVTSLPPVTFTYQDDVELVYNINDFNSAMFGDNKWRVRWVSSPNLDGSLSPEDSVDSYQWSQPHIGSGEGGETDFWDIDNMGNIDLYGKRNMIYWMQTYLYVDQAKDIFNAWAPGGVDVNVWLNNDYIRGTHQTWNLNAGYNQVDITLYHGQGSSFPPEYYFIFDLNLNLPAKVDLMNPDQDSTFPVIFTGDFNGDGFADIARQDTDAGEVWISLFEGGTFSPFEIWYSNIGNDETLFSGDFNGDGKVDIGSYTDGSGNWHVMLSDGSQFINDGIWMHPFGTYQKFGTGDFNGDGLADFVTYFLKEGGMRARIGLSTGTSFELWTTEQGPIKDFFINDSGDNAIATDFNGDGLTDFVSYEANGSRLWIILNKGDLHLDFEQFPMIWNAGLNARIIVADVDSDGFPDIGAYDNSLGKVIFIMSKGMTFPHETQLSFEFGLTQSSDRVQSSDFNGDGLADYMVYNNVGRFEIALSDGVAPDLLASVNNGAGGVTSIAYAPSTQCDNTSLPFVIQMATSVTASNSRGDSYETTYHYSGGAWNSGMREFRGYSMVTATDPQGNYSETDYLQDDLYKGRTAKTRTYDSLGNLLSETVNTWAAQEIVPGSNFVFLKRKDNFVYDGNATGRRTAEEFFYDELVPLGNLTKALQYGEVDILTGNDIDNDTRIVETSYVHNTIGTPRLIGLPRETVVYDNAGAVVRKTTFFYDNHLDSTAQPVLGLLTKKEDWAGDGPQVVHPVTQYTYDATGNLLTTTDPLGNVTAIAYDPTYNIFPVTTTNALNHSVVNEYYGVDGVLQDAGDGYAGLWGQLKSTTDPNQQRGKRSYNTFGDLIATVSPLDSIAFPTQTTDIEYLTDHIRITTRQRVEHGQPQTIDAVTFIDGLGRTIQTKTNAATAGQYIVSGQTEYNTRGLPEKQYLNKFTSNGLTVIDPIDPLDPHMTLEYDAVGRTLKTTNPDTTYSNVIYDDWGTVTINENGHRQKSVFDAYGRLKKKREFTGADGRGAPTYPATGGYTLYATTLYFYDSEGNLTKTKDAHNNVTTISYDNLGRKIAMNDPDMGAWQYEYDLNGNLVKQTDAKGQVIHFTYDALNRLTNKTDGASLNVDYTYDNPLVTHSKGRLTQAQYSGGDTEFEYDAIGREIQSIKAINNQNYGVGRNYDALNNLLDVQYPDGGKIFYQYNPVGQIEAISNDPALFEQQSFLLDNHDHWEMSLTGRTSYVVHRTSVLDVSAQTAQTEVRTTMYEVRNTKYDVRTTNDEPRSTMYEVRSTNFLKNIGSIVSNFYTQWFEPNILGIKPAYAEDSWVFVRLEDRPGATLDDDKGRSKRGDIIQIVPAVAGEEPTAKEKAEYAIFVVSDIASADKKSYQKSHWKEELDEYGNLIPVKKAFRTKKYNGLRPGTKPGFHKNSKIKNRDFKKGIRKKTQFDYLSYSLKSRFYAYAQRPVNRLADIITPNAQAADDISKICAVGPNCTDEDYNTLAAWEDANDGDLVAAQTRKIAEVYNDDGPLSGGVLIDGSTTNSSYYMVIRAPAGERHSGTKGTGVVINGDPSGESVIQLDDNYPRIEWIECDGSDNSDTLDSGCIGTTLYGGHLTGRQIKNVLVYDSVDHGIYMTGTALLYNSFIFNNADTGVRSSYANDTLTVVNTTSYNNGNHGFYAQNSSQDIDNCVSMANGGLDYGESKGTGNFFNVDYSMSSDGTADNWSGTGVLINQTTADQFVSTTLPDLHLKAGSNAIDAGIDLGASNGEQIDIDGWDRDAQGDVWDMGADETVSQSGLSAPTLNSATAGDTQVTLDWTSVSSATGYNVYYGTTSGTYGTPIDVGNVTNYIVTGLTNDTTYYFVVTSTDATEESADSNEQSATPAAPPPSGSLILDVRVVAGADDAEEKPDQTVTLGGSDLELVEDPATQIVGIRFRNIQIPQGSQITNAYVQFQVDEVTTDVTNLVIRAQASGNAAKFKTQAADISSRPVTGASANWSPAAWNTVGEAGNDQRTPNIANVIQEVINRTDWASGNRLAIIITGTGKRTAESYNGDNAGAPLLHIEYNENSSGLTAPTLNDPVPGDAQINLDWNAITGATGYKVKYGTASGVYGAPVDVGNVTSHTVSGLTNDTTYYFVVTAYSATEESIDSNEKSATPVAPLPPSGGTDYTQDPNCEAAYLLDGNANDSSGHGRNGIVGGALHEPNGKFGGSYQFDGVDDYIDIGTFDPSAGDMTITMWVKSQGTTGAYEGVIAKRDSWDPSGMRWQLLLHNTDGSFYFLREGSYALYNSTVSSGGAWNHIALVHQAGGNDTLYVNGNAVQSLPAITFGSKTDAGVVIGNVESGGSVEVFNGSMDEVAIFSRTLAQNEIQEIMNDGLVGQTDPLQAPTLNNPTPGDTKVDLDWNAVTGATGYKVKYGTSSGIYGVPVDVGNVTSHTVSGLTNDTTYYFVVTAYSATEESGDSNEKSAIPFSGVIDPQLFVANVEYNASGQVTEITYGNGTVTTNTYDPLNLRLTRIETRGPSNELLQDLNYTYDPVGNILSITDNVNTADQTFQYDAQNRLVEAVGETYGIKTYTYDEIGNITEKDGRTYTYNDMSYENGGGGPHAVTSMTDGTTFTYDANGNMATKQAPDLTLTEYIYDVENRLVEVKKDSLTIAQYEYDGDGGRTTKTTGGVTTKFIGSLYEQATGSGSRATKYVFFGDTRIASITNGNVLYYHPDHLGGTNITTDFEGTQKELIEYKPFGGYARHDKPVDDIDSALFYFTGKRIDDETGLYYYGARYYDPDIGRFITADTIVPGATNPQAFNRYSYGGNNPVSNLEDGHGFWKAFAAAFIGAVATIVTAGIAAGGVAALLGSIAEVGFVSAIGTTAFAVGGAVAGASGAAFNGAGWQGILQGAAIGGIMGGIGGQAAAGGFGNASAWIGGGLLAGGIANAAVNDSWAEFAGGIAGSVTGTAFSLGAAKMTLSNPAKIEGQMNQQLEQKTNSNTIQEVNQQKGNPGAVAKGAEAIAQKAADTKTVVVQEVLVVKVGPEAQPIPVIEGALGAVGDFSSAAGDGIAWHDAYASAANNSYKLVPNVETVIIKAAAALDVVPSSHVRSLPIPAGEQYIGKIGRHEYYFRRQRYEYGPK